MENEIINGNIKSLDIKKEELERKKEEKCDYEIKMKDKLYISEMAWAVVAIITALGIVLKFHDIDISFGDLLFRCLSPGFVLGVPTCIIYIKGCKKCGSMEKEIEKLEKEVEEESKIEKDLEKKKLKGKAKSVSNDTKKILNDLLNSEDIKTITKDFNMSYEELLELYEKSNGFDDDYHIEEAIENLNAFSDNENIKKHSVKTKHES